MDSCVEWTRIACTTGFAGPEPVPLQMTGLCRTGLAIDIARLHLRLGMLFLWMIRCAEGFEFPQMRIIAGGSVLASGVASAVCTADHRLVLCRGTWLARLAWHLRLVLKLLRR